MTAPTRPPIGTRVRIRGNTGIINVAGRVGDVVAHHEDGMAFVVELVIGDRITLDPENVDIARPPVAP